ncbi:MAG: L,D-transpeptidase [Hyphomicrobiaceae bacterium]
MLRAALALVMIGAVAPSALAQEWWMPWSQPGYRAPSYASPRYDEDRYGPRERPRGQALMSGGPRPNVSPQSPDTIAFVSSYEPGTIVIDTAGRKLYLVKSPRQAFVYPISVGREGFTWTGTERISRIANWPDWHPPETMRQRQPYLPLRMTGGVYNPLGAKALYLGNTLYRIHGTDDPRTIGRATSSGCFRMTNGHVVDLARRVGVGTTVVVVNRLTASVARVGG